MKSYLAILIFLSSSISLESIKNNQFGEIWIGKYQKSIQEGNVSFTSLDQAIEFNGDLCLVKTFNRDFLYWDVKIDTIRTSDNRRLFHYNEKSLTNPSEARIESSFLYIKHNESLTNVYQRLPKFKQARNEVAFKKLISNSIFIPNKHPTKIEFNKNHKVLISNLDYYFGDHQYWILDSYLGELFLIIDGMSGIVLHIKEFNDHSFTGINYGKENIENEFRVIDSKEKFDLRQLNGRWQAVQKDSPLPPFENEIDSLKYHDKETLVFQDSIMTRSLYFWKDTLKWQSNITSELMVIPEISTTVKQRQWNIKELTDEFFVIERVTDRKARIGRNPKIEIVKFERIE